MDPDPDPIFSSGLLEWLCLVLTREPREGSQEASYSLQDVHAPCGGSGGGLELVRPSYPALLWEVLDPPPFPSSRPNILIRLLSEHLDTDKG